MKFAVYRKEGTPSLSLQSQPAEVAGAPPQDYRRIDRQVHDCGRLDAAVAAFFILCVIVVLVASLREWWLVLSGRKVRKSTEEPFEAAAFEAAGG